MKHKAVILVLTASSVALSFGSMLSHWHPMHVSQVWNKGAKWVDLQGGGMRWFYEDHRGQFGTVGAWTSSGQSVLRMFDYRTTSYGYNWH